MPPAECPLPAVGTQHAASASRMPPATSLHCKKLIPMANNKPYPERKSPRAKWCHYNEGFYFVTICTKNHVHSLGEIINGMMKLSVIGSYVNEMISSAMLHFPNIRVTKYVVMPNHLHLLVHVEEGDGPEESSTSSHGALANFVRSLKASVTRYAHQECIPFSWQGRYHDHVIRGVDDMNNISSYIEHNVEKWDLDKYAKYR